MSRVFSSFIVLLNLSLLFFSRNSIAYNVLRPLFLNRAPENVNTESSFVTWTSTTKRAQKLLRECPSCYDSNRVELKLDIFIRNQESRSSSIQLNQNGSLNANLNNDFFSTVKQIELPSINQVDICSRHLTTLTIVADQLKILSNSYNILYILLLTTALLSAINLYILLRFHIPARVSTAAINHTSHSNDSSQAVESTEMLTPLKINKRHVQTRNYTDSANTNLHPNSCHSISTKCYSHRYGDNQTYSSAIEGFTRRQYPNCTETANESYLPIAAASTHRHSSHLQNRLFINVNNSPQPPISWSLSMKKCRAFYTAISSPCNPNRNPTNDNNIGDISDIYGCVDVVDESSQQDEDSDLHVDNELEKDNCVHRSDSNIQLDLTQLYGEDNDDFKAFDGLDYANDLHDIEHRNRSISHNGNEMDEEMTHILSPCSPRGLISNSRDHEYFIDNSSAAVHASHTAKNCETSELDFSPVEFDFSVATDTYGNFDNNMEDDQKIHESKTAAICAKIDRVNCEDQSLQILVDPFTAASVGELEKKKWFQQDECQQIVAELNECVSRLKAKEHLSQLVVDLLTSDSPYCGNDSRISAILSTARQLLRDNQAYTAANVSRALSQDFFCFTLSKNSNIYLDDDDYDWMNSRMHFISGDDSLSSSCPSLTTNSSISLCSDSSTECSPLTKHLNNKNFNRWNHEVDPATSSCDGDNDLSPQHPGQEHSMGISYKSQNIYRKQM